MIIIMKMQWLPSVRTVASKHDNNQLPQVRRYLSKNCMEQPWQTLHGMAVLHPCGAWSICL